MAGSYPVIDEESPPNERKKVVFSNLHEIVTSFREMSCYAFSYGVNYCRRISMAGLEKTPKDYISPDDIRKSVIILKIMGAIADLNQLLG